MYSVFGPSVPDSWYTYVCQALCVIDLVDALQQYTVGGTCCCVPRSVPLVAECGVVVHLHCFFSTDRYLNIRAVCS